VLKRFTAWTSTELSKVYFSIMSYTFGDTEQASRRLRRLAEIYEPESCTLLQSALNPREKQTVRVTVDPGCRPGWSTRLLQFILQPERTIGLDSSERYVLRRV
jgi:trans-aconitate 2-methyltransferase